MPDYNQATEAAGKEYDRKAARRTLILVAVVIALFVTIFIGFISLLH